MKIFVATKRTQGQRKSDFSFTEEGEAVIYPHTCDRDKKSRNPDSGCGCARSMVGMITHKATTTVEVMEWGISKNQFIRDYLGTLQDAGHHVAVRSKEQRFYHKILAHDLMNNAAQFEVGDVVEYRNGKFSKRKS